MTRTGLTQASAAKEFSVSQGTVSDWLNGSLPRPQKLSEIAKYFGVDAIDLTGASIALPQDMEKIRVGKAGILEERGDFGAWFKEIREKHHQFLGDKGAERFGALMKVSRATVYNWEKSHRIPPKWNWERASGIFGANLEDMFYFSKNMQTPLEAEVYNRIDTGAKGDAYDIKKSDADLDAIINELHDKFQRNENPDLRWWYLDTLAEYAKALSVRLKNKE